MQNGLINLMNMHIALYQGFLKGCLVLDEQHKEFQEQRAELYNAMPKDVWTQG